MDDTAEGTLETERRVRIDRIDARGARSRLRELRLPRACYGIPDEGSILLPPGKASVVLQLAASVLVPDDHEPSTGSCTMSRHEKPKQTPPHKNHDNCFE